VPAYPALCPPALRAGGTPTSRKRLIVPLTSTAYVIECIGHVHRTYRGGAHANDHPDRADRLSCPRHPMRGMADPAARLGPAPGGRARARLRRDARHDAAAVRTALRRS